MMDKTKEHVSKHCESKLDVHCEKESKKLIAVGISKEACNAGCHEDLTRLKIDVKPTEPGTKTVKNRKNRDEIAHADEIEVRSTIDRSKQYESDVHFLSNNVQFSKKVFIATVKSNVKNSVKPGASVGLISGRCCCKINKLNFIFDNNSLLAIES